MRQFKSFPADDPDVPWQRRREVTMNRALRVLAACVGMALLAMFEALGAVGEQNPSELAVLVWRGTPWRSGSHLCTWWHVLVG